MKDLNKKLGKLVRKLRKGRGFTRDEVSKRTGMDKKDIATFEKGELDLKVTELITLTEALEIDPSDFFMGLPSKHGRKDHHMISQWLDLVLDADDETMIRLLAVNNEIVKQFKQKELLKKV